MNATIAIEQLLKDLVTSPEASVISVVKNVTPDTAKRLCLLMSNLLGEAALRALLNVAEDANVTKNGNVQCSRVMGFDVCGVEEMSGWKLTTSRSGAYSLNYATRSLIDAHSV